MNFETDITGFVIGAQPYARQPDATTVAIWATGLGIHAGWSKNPDDAYVYKTWKEAFKDLTRGCRGLRNIDAPGMWYLGGGAYGPAGGLDRHVFTVGELMAAQFEK